MIPFLSTILMIVVALAGVASADAAKDEEAAMPFSIIDVPFANAHDTVVTGLTPARQVLGVYTDEAGNTHGFLRSRAGRVFPLLMTIPQDITPEGLVTGFFTAPAPATESFWYFDGTLRPFRVPRPGGPGTPATLLTEATVITPSGKIWGDYRSGVDGKFYGFRYDPDAGTFLTIAHPDGGLSTAVVGLDGEEGVLVRVVGNDAITRYFAYDHDTGVFTLLTIPELPDGEFVGRTSSGWVAGNSGLTGFLWHPESGVQLIEKTGAVLTDVNGVQDVAGIVRVFGRFLDADGNHGFIARPPFPASARHARQHADKMHAKFEQEHCCPGSKRAICREGR
jgi:hypothetical protein